MGGGRLVNEKKKRSIVSLEEDGGADIPYCEGLIWPEFLDAETNTAKMPSFRELPVLDPSHFSIGISFKPEHDFDQYDITLRERIVSSLLKKWFMIAERRCTSQKTGAADESRYYVLGVTELWLELNAERLQYTLQIKNPPESLKSLYKIYDISIKEEFALFDGCKSTEDVQGSLFTPATRGMIIHAVLEETLKNALYHSPVSKVFLLHNPKEVLQIKKATKTPFLLPLVSAKRRKIFVEYVRRYFGERRGLYFAFIIFYTLSLFPLALMGSLVFGLYRVPDARPYLEPIWVGILVIWTAAWMNMWLRHRHNWSYKWNMLGYKTLAKERLEFTGKTVWNPVTNKNEKVYPAWRRMLFRHTVTVFVMSMMVACAGLLVVACIIFRGAQLLPPFFAYKVTGFLMGLSANVANGIMTRISRHLTNFENHRDAHTWEDAFILKVFSICCVNTFLYFYYVTFLQGRMKTYFGLDVWWDLPCPDNDCVKALETLVCYHMIADIFVQQTFEIGIPLCKYLWKVCRRKHGEMRENRNLLFFKFVDAQRNRDPLNVFDDYSEMVLQFGIVTLFSTAFPLAPLLAFANNIIEIGMDYYKFVFIGGRPVPQKAEDIGTWLLCIRILSFFAILTNCAYLCFVSTTSTVRDEAWTYKFFAFFVLEHILIVIQVFFLKAIPIKTWSLRNQLRIKEQLAQVESARALKDRNRAYEELAQEKARIINERKKHELEEAEKHGANEVNEDDPLLGHGNKTPTSMTDAFRFF